MRKSKFVELGFIPYDKMGKPDVGLPNWMIEKKEVDSGGKE